MLASSSVRSLVLLGLSSLISAESSASVAPVLVLGSDACAVPAAIAGSGPFTFDNTSATTGAEGQGNANCLYAATTGISQDLWFTWQATWAGAARISLCSPVPQDTKVAVYSGAGCPVTPALACNDDGPTCGSQAELCFPTIAGLVYTIQIGNRPGTPAGTGQFTIVDVPVPVGCRYDDGSSEQALGSGGGEMLWMHRYGAVGQVTLISAVSTCFGTPTLPGSAPPVGTAIRALLWDDPNDDGNPTDAVLLRQVVGTVGHVDADVFDTFMFATPAVASGVFFVGVTIAHTALQAPAPLDKNGCPQGSFGRAWIAGNPGSVNVNNLALNALPPTELNAFGAPGVWLLRAVEDVACTATPALGPEVPPQIVCNVVPDRWRGTDVIWSGDVSPHNHIDDLLDAQAGPHDIVVNFRKPVTVVELGLLEGMSPTSFIQYACQYISSVAMGNVSSSDITLIETFPGVAFIEKQSTFTPFLDVSLRNIKLTAGCYSPNTVQDAYPTIDGTGCNIAIIDTGVDDAHLTFAATPVIAGFEVDSALTLIPGNPSDFCGHGTLVASIALGQGVGVVSRGVAPKAGLIDVKIMNCNGSWPQATKGLEYLYTNRAAWNVKVVNMSFGNAGSNHDGTEAFSQLVDLGESLGMVMVAAIGNSGPGNIGMSTPGAAARAITVGAYDDLNTCTRTDDIIWNNSSRGPRANDLDFDCVDERKPDVVAPGVNIVCAQALTTSNSFTASGTSLAAPHVAGLAALICQAKCPGASPALIKSLIISTAEPRLPVSLPVCDPLWNKDWGWGYIDAFKAINAPGIADITFPNPFPNPPWLSPDIMTSSVPSTGATTTVSVKVVNSSNVQVFGVRVHFGVHVYSASIPTFHDIGTKVHNLLPGMSTVTMPWQPKVTGHQCLQVEIGYGQDTNCNNNIAGLNLNVANSPVTFELQNTLTTAPANIELEVTCANGTLDHWNVCLIPSEITLSGCDPPVEVMALALPTQAAVDGETILVHVAARIGTQLLGGVSFLATKRDCNGNNVEDYLDIADGTSADVNANHVPDECDASTFCFGDSTGNACPCGNVGTTGRGCANSAFAAGAILTSSGVASVTAGNDTLVLTASDVPGPGLFFQGDGQFGGGLGIQFGDGFLCAGGAILRLGVVFPTGTQASYPGGLTPNPIHIAGSTSAGDVRHYQCWYRDAGESSPGVSFCTPSTYNLTQGLTRIWGP